MKPKKCVVCNETFQPFRQFQKACSVDHAIKHARIQEQKKHSKEKREQKRKDKKRLDELRPRKYWLNKAQQIFNTYIRLRDQDDSCISCDRPPDSITWKGGGKFDCGHYRSRGAASHLRFDPRNAHKQCVQCNRSLSGNIVEYRKRLILKIGKEDLEALENDNNVKKWTIPELKGIIEAYSQKIKLLKVKR